MGLTGGGAQGVASMGLGKVAYSKVTGGEGEQGVRGEISIGLDVQSRRVLERFA